MAYVGQSELTIEQRRYLFVGGPADGQWISTNGDERYLMSDPAPPIMEGHLLKAHAEPQPVATFLYERESFHDGNYTWYVYFYARIDKHARWWELINGYRKS